MLAALLSSSVIGAGAAGQTLGIHAMSVLAQASSGPLRCEIRKDAASGAVELTGIIVGARHIVGAFRFVVTKSGKAGSSNIAQSDRFDLDPDKEKTVGHIQIGLERDGHVIADLSVRSDDGLECRATAQVGQSD